MMCHDVPWAMAPHAVDLFHSVVGLPFLVGFEGLERLERLLRPIGCFAFFFLNMFSMFSMLDIVGPYGSSKIDGQQLQ